MTYSLLITDLARMLLSQTCIVMGRFGSELQSEPKPDWAERQFGGLVWLFFLNQTNGSVPGSAKP